MNRIFIIFFFFIILPSGGYSQEEVKLGVDSTGKYYHLSGDSMPYIELEEVYVFPPRVFKNKRQQRRYTRLVRYIKKVLPYAKIAGAEVKKMNEELEKISDEKERKKFIKGAEKRLFERFEGELVKLTINQGRILFQLIYRETGDTSYDLVKDFKGSFTAFFWQGVARIFGSNLKLEYDPDGDDRMIEEIIIMIEAGLL